MNELNLYNLEKDLEKLYDPKLIVTKLTSLTNYQEVLKYSKNIK